MFQVGEPVEVIKGDHRGMAFFVKDIEERNGVLTYVYRDGYWGELLFTRDMLNRASSD
jgi:hypothetical protein